MVHSVLLNCILSNCCAVLIILSGNLSMYTRTVRVIIEIIEWSSYISQAASDVGKKKVKRISSRKRGDVFLGFVSDGDVCCKSE